MIDQQKLVIGLNPQMSKLVKLALKENPLTVETCFELLFLAATNPAVSISGISLETIEKTGRWLQKEVDTFEEQWKKAMSTYKSFADWLTTMSEYRAKLLVVYDMLTRPHILCNCEVCHLKKNQNDYYAKVGRN